MYSTVSQQGVRRNMPNTSAIEGFLKNYLAFLEGSEFTGEQNWSSFINEENTFGYKQVNEIL